MKKTFDIISGPDTNTPELKLVKTTMPEGKLSMNTSTIRALIENTPKLKIAEVLTLQVRV
ncbi:MAG: hypothetical protein CBB92_13130 [Flammeovirgaceae bacterium TMED32]|nr:MAG: hypothetical protein CBB92_13130 [Flammeovirgaceae bacterium TMED32]|tara:strand:+ start:1507 stop:1686 length:180 start_codon:yes stop_codon:yes gene_type:complete